MHVTTYTVVQVFVTPFETFGKSRPSTRSRSIHNDHTSYAFTREIFDEIRHLSFDRQKKIFEPLILLVPRRHLRLNTIVIIILKLRDTVYEKNIFQVKTTSNKPAARL